MRKGIQFGLWECVPLSYGTERASLKFMHQDQGGIYRESVVSWPEVGWSWETNIFFFLKVLLDEYSSLGTRVRYLNRLGHIQVGVSTDSALCLDWGHGVSVQGSLITWSLNSESPRPQCASSMRKEGVYAVTTYSLWSLVWGSVLCLVLRFHFPDLRVLRWLP